MSLARSIVPLSALLLLSASPLILSKVAPAQSGNRVIVMNDGQNGPTINHLSMPDMEELRRPDFSLRDLQMFTERLLLSDAQRAALERQIAAYLEAFEKLKLNSFPPGMPEAKMLRMGGEDGEPGAMAMLLDAAEDVPRIEVNAENFPEGVTLGVRVAVNGPAEGEAAGDGGDAAPTVAVRVATPDGEPVSEEMQKKIDAAVAKAVEQLQKQMQERAAAGEPPLPDPQERIERLMQRQEELAQRAEQFSKAKAQLRQEFVVEAQSMLSDVQLDRWPLLERALLIDRQLPKGRLSGERTNLVSLAREFSLPLQDHLAVAAELDQYEIALEQALRQRDQYLESTQPRIDRAMREQQYERALSMMDRGASLRVAIRSVNEQYADLIAENMPAEVAETFRQRVLEASYPRVYRETHAQRTLAAALALDKIDERTRSTLNDLQRTLSFELTEMNAQIRRTINKVEPTRPRATVEHLRRLQQGESPMDLDPAAADEPIRQAFARRQALETRYVSAIHGLLTPEQIALLPKPEAREHVKAPLIIGGQSLR